MRVISCTLQNFASYKSLEFNFENQGLCLIAGPTGSGKSTLCDAIPWCLFGRTAKDGAVDEVLSWPGDQITTGVLRLWIEDKQLTIVRTRGKSAKDNDLYWLWHHTGNNVHRGKDLNDTQKLINNLLGFDSALYLSGAYFHEFSQTAQFFTTTAKNRRLICEQLVDLALAKNLQIKITEAKKELQHTVSEISHEVDVKNNLLRFLSKPNDYKQKAETFKIDKAFRIEDLACAINELRVKIKPAKYFFDKNRELTQAAKDLGDSRCSECGAKKHGDKHEHIARMRSVLTNDSNLNSYDANKLNSLELELVREQKTKNTYNDLIKKLEKDKKTTKAEIFDLELKHNDIKSKLADHELLLDVVNDFRGVTIKNTIGHLEDQTNRLLSDHFDAEIRVTFDVIDADKLDVTILKDGNICSFTQLSKGQRQLLKLCFAVSVMRAAANHSGVSFNCAFFDEALSGLDDLLKIKAFRLFETLGLEYESIFIIDHSEGLKQAFTNKYTVSLTNGSSQIEKNS